MKGISRKEKNFNDKIILNEKTQEIKTKKRFTIYKKIKIWPKRFYISHTILKTAFDSSYVLYISSIYFFTKSLFVSTWSNHYNDLGMKSDYIEVIFITKLKV